MFWERLFKNIKVISLAPLVLMILIIVPPDNLHWSPKNLEILRDWLGLEEEKLEGLKGKGVILMLGSYNWGYETSKEVVSLTACVKVDRETLLPEVFLKSSVERFCQTV